MKSTTAREPRYVFDSRGNELALITLANHTEPAVLFREDYERLRALGLTGLWTLNSNGQGRSYVRCMVHSRLQTVARLIANAGRRIRIEYVDNDPLNLRATNLEARRGKALYAATVSR